MTSPNMAKVAMAFRSDLIDDQADASITPDLMSRAASLDGAPLGALQELNQVVVNLARYRALAIDELLDRLEPYRGASDTIGGMIDAIPTTNVDDREAAEALVSFMQALAGANDAIMALVADPH